MKLTAATLALTVTALASGCGAHGSPAKPQLDPASFTTHIDNPWMPLAPGSRWVYRETAGKSVQRNRVDVTRRTKLIEGVHAVVVHDVVTAKGKLVEDTFDWFAQDRHGNVWYMGEDTKEYSGHGPPSTAGSWQAGVKNAKPGIVMKAHPKAGQSYRQEFLKGEAEDRARVLSVKQKAQVPLGYYPHALMTSETTALEPHLVELKLYTRGVGNVLTVAISGENSREELLSFRRGSG